MTEMTMQRVGRDPQLLARRLSNYVKPKGTAKELADLIGCDARTAENIRSGHWPIARHWMGLWLAFGDDLLEAVFRPNAAVERLEREIRRLELAKLEAERLAADDASGLRPRGPQAAARHENRTARVAPEHRSFDR